MPLAIEFIPFHIKYEGGKQKTRYLVVLSCD